MNKNQFKKQSPLKSSQEFGSIVGKKAILKMDAQDNTSGVWFGLGMMGLVGWSVIVPTLAGTALGAWLDKHYPRGQSWTLIFLVIGLIAGCFNAWFWIKKQHFDIHEKNISKHRGSNE